MKKSSIKLFMAAIACALCGLSSYAADLFPSLYDSPNIETVYVSKAMMMNSNKSRSILFDQLNIYDSKNLDDLYVYSAKNPEGIELAQKALADYRKKNKNLEVLMRTKSEKEESVIYGMPSEKPGFYSNIIIMNNGKSFSMVVLSGSINLNFGQMGFTFPKSNGILNLDQLKQLDLLKQLKQLDQLKQLKSSAHLERMSRTSARRSPIPMV